MHSTQNDMPSHEIAAVLSWQEDNAQENKYYVKHGDTVELGREASNDVVIKHQEVSRRHAVLVDRGNRIFELSDLGSTNGTCVNGKKVTSLYQLKDGDKIRIGEIEISFSIYEHHASNSSVPQYETLVVKSDMKQPRLIVTAGKQEGRKYPLSSQVIQIGRETSRFSCDIALQDRAISRPHVELRKQGQDYILEDLKSANGTILNGKDLLDSQVLMDGDVITLGETTLLYRAK